MPRPACRCAKRPRGCCRSWTACRLRTVAPDVPEEVAAVVATALAPEVADRFATMRAMLEALRACPSVAGNPSAATPRARTWLRGALLGAALTAGAMTVWGVTVW